MLLKHELSPCDALFVLCSNDVRVAEYAAELYHKGLAPIIVFSGGEGRFTDGLFDKSEAETFAAIVRDVGVPPDAIFMETQSTNTGENVLFTYQLVQDKGLTFDDIILVQKPFMERRALATFEKQWPGSVSKLAVTSSAQPFFEYINEEMPLDMVVRALIEDFERIKTYPEKGFQTYQEVPDIVESSYKYLKQHYPYL